MYSLYYQDYGLDSLAKNVAKATETLKEYTGKANDWYDNYKSFTDYAIGKISEGKVYKITTWFEIEQRPKKPAVDTTKPKRERRKLDPRQNYRRGLLIKKAT